jgi:hypothetical protein
LRIGWRRERRKMRKEEDERGVAVLDDRNVCLITFLLVNSTMNTINKKFREGEKKG